MLSEGYLCGISYWTEENMTSVLYPEAVDNAELKSICGFNYTSVAISKDTICCQDSVPQIKRSSFLKRHTSPVVEILGDFNLSRELYLVPSTCKSICTNYSDLHIAGDQVMPMNSEVTEFTCDRSFAFCERPFLESCQIPPPMEFVASPAESEPLPKKCRGNTSFWRRGSSKEKSIMQQEQPLSNSVLNEYLEQKVMELYKSYIMDRNVKNASPNEIMASDLILNNVDQISVQISREQNMETTKAKDMVISCLLRLASGKISAEISTPQLQISQDDNTQ
ncbi:TLR adapter interacting with SLC15A4 on the lysosome [Pleurodeles waltl]|uniref:TLR adapter interacting with SLC15A4 on the lysosome n=1 Tax=Pleurodeles waltl TaxID=8319 RepID=UPI0037098E88